MKQYEQFLQKFPDVHHLEIKPTHIFSSVQERRAQIPETDDFCIICTCGEQNQHWNLNYCDLVEGEE